MNLKHTLIPALLLLITMSSFADNDKKIAPSEIKEVKIYTTGAVVTRNAKTTVEVGTTALEFNNLSSGIDKQSVSVTGTGDVTILSVQYNLNYLTEEQKPLEVRVLEDSLAQFKHDMSKLNNLEMVYKDELEMIKANKSIRNDKEGVTVDNLKDVADFYRRRLIDIKSKLLDISGSLKSLNEDIARVSLQLATLDYERKKPTGSIIVTISSHGRTEVNLAISYLIYQAGWSPLYDIRAKDISSPITLNYKANVFQKSGEDWKNVHITLSTGNPTISGVMPALYSMHLNYVAMLVSEEKPPAKGTFSSARASGESGQRHENVRMLDQVQVASDSIRLGTGDYPVGSSTVVTGKISDKSKEANMEQDVSNLSNDIAVNQNQLSVDFEISIPYTVPSDGKTYTIDVRQYEMNAIYSYHTIPKLDRDAFLIARVTGWDTLNILSGNANIFFENSFIGASYLQLQNTKDTLEISLGRDKRIVINRDKQKDFSSNQTLGSNQVKSLSYEISVRNTKAEAINIVIEDQIPVADNKDITVKMIENSKAEYNDKTGTLTWKLNVNPSETQKKKLAFSVKYPKDQEISNL